MKLIILYAFGGLLKSEPIAVQEYTPDYRLPYYKQLFASPVNLSSFNEPARIQQAKFIRTDKYEIFNNRNTANIYELELES